MSLNLMIIDEHNKFVQDQHGQILLDAVPNLGFGFIKIEFLPHVKLRWVSIEGVEGWAALEPAHINAIEQFIASERLKYGIRVPAVDATGKYLGRVRNDNPQIFKVVLAQPPNDDGWRYDFDTDEWRMAYGYKADGSQAPLDDPELDGFTFEKPPMARGPMMPVKWFHTDGIWGVSAGDRATWTPLVKQDMMTAILLGIISMISANLTRNGESVESVVVLKFVLNNLQQQINNWMTNNSAKLKNPTEVAAALAAINTFLNNIDNPDILLVHEKFEELKILIGEVAVISSEFVDTSDLMIGHYIEP